MHRLMIVCAAVAAAAAPCWAAPLVFKEVAKPAVYAIPGRAVDVEGVAPGMSPDTVKAALEKRFGPVQVTEDTMGIAYQGAQVASQRFTSKMSARGDGRQIEVVFGTPTTGNAVVEVAEQTNFNTPTTAPAMTQLRAELVARYGPPASEGAATAGGELYAMAWTYGAGGKPAPCPGGACRADLSPHGLDATEIPALERAVRAGRRLTIVATLLAGVTDPTRASGLTVSVSDVATKLQTLQAAISQMRGAARGGKP